MNEDFRLGDGKVKDKFCGNLLPAFSSKGPRMVITLNSTGSVQGGSFAASYFFISGEHTVTFFYQLPSIGLIVEVSPQNGILSKT